MNPEEIKKAQSYFSSIGLDTRKIDVDSPVKEFQLGDTIQFFADYGKGLTEIKSKVVRIYKEVPHWNGVPSEVKKHGGSAHSCWAQLEDGKKVLLGYFEYKNKFEIASSFLETEINLVSLHH
jgi:hypothetical protein